MIVVSNATPIISLASIGQIDILKHFFDKVYIPQAVYDEIKSKKAFGYQEIDDGFFQVEPIKDEFAQNILLNLVGNNSPSPMGRNLMLLK